MANEKDLETAQYRVTSTGGKPADLGDMTLAHKAGQLAEAFKGRLPTSRELENITSELSIEMATAILHRVLIDSPVHGEILKRMRSIDPSDPLDRRPIQKQIEVTILASNFFRSGRKWGDHVELWRKWARDIGFTTDVIETQAKLSVSENARVIREYLTRHPHQNRFIVTYGQGASELRFLMQKMQVAGVEEAFAGVRGWLNVCGSFAGSGVSTMHNSTWLKRLFEKIDLRLHGRNPVTLAQTSTDFSMWRQPIEIPSGISVVNIVGLPLIQQLPVKLQLSYQQLAETSPNDGLLRFWESVAPGVVIPVVGMGHQAPEAQLKPVFLRTLMLLAASLDEQLNRGPREPSLELMEL